MMQHVERIFGTEEILEQVARKTVQPYSFHQKRFLLRFRFGPRRLHPRDEIIVSTSECEEANKRIPETLYACTKQPTPSGTALYVFGIDSNVTGENLIQDQSNRTRAYDPDRALSIETISCWWHNLSLSLSLSQYLYMYINVPV